MNKLQGQSLPIRVNHRYDDLYLSVWAYRTYEHLVRRGGKDGYAYPSYESIGEHCFRASLPYAKTASLRTKAMCAVKELEAIGAIRVERGAGRKTNRFHLVPQEEWLEQALEKQARETSPKEKNKQQIKEAVLADLSPMGTFELSDDGFTSTFLVENDDETTTLLEESEGVEVIPHHLRGDTTSPLEDNFGAVEVIPHDPWGHTTSPLVFQSAEEFFAALDEGKTDNDLPVEVIPHHLRGDTTSPKDIKDKKKEEDIKEKGSEKVKKTKTKKRDATASPDFQKTWDWLTELVYGSNSPPLTKTQRGQVARQTKELLEIHENLDTLKRRYAAGLTKQFPNWRPTSVWSVGDVCSKGIQAAPAAIPAVVATDSEQSIADKIEYLLPLPDVNFQKKRYLKAVEALEYCRGYILSPAIVGKALLDLRQDPSWTKLMMAYQHPATHAETVELMRYFDLIESAEWVEKTIPPNLTW